MGWRGGYVRRIEVLKMKKIGGSYCENATKSRDGVGRGFRSGGGGGVDVYKELKLL